MYDYIITFLIILIVFLILYIIGVINKKRKLRKLSHYTFSNSGYKILKEEDHVTCFLCLKNGDFASGQMNGLISLYNHSDFSLLELIIEHCAPVTSLTELNDGTILTSSADGTLKKIKLYINEQKKNKRHLVEFVFYTNKEFIFKGIQIKNSDDILSCNITKELILWKKTVGEIELYKVNKIVLKNENVYDIFQINENVFITCGDCIRCWDVNNYEIIKKLNYCPKGNSSIYKLNQELTGIFLKTKGDILIFNNNDLIGIKVINLSNFSLTSLKSLINNTIILGIFDEKNHKSFVKQYLINIENENENEKKSLFNNIEIKEIKEEVINYDQEDIYFDEFNWLRINTIEQLNDFIIIGTGGKYNVKNIGNLMIFEKNK